MILARARAGPAIFAATVAAAALAAIGGIPAAVSPAGAQEPEYNLPPRYLTPVPVVRLTGELTRAGVRVRLLRVKAPRSSTVTVRCRGGRKRGCPFRSITKIVPTLGRVRFKEVQRPLRAGARLSIFVRRGNTIGKYTRFTIRKRKAPRRTDACLLPGAPFKPRSCP